MPEKLYLFAGGGTGGHLYPGLAVAEAVRRREPDARIVFFTTDRPLDRDLLARSDYDQVPQSVRPFSSRPWHWPRFYRIWRQNVEAAKAYIRENRVEAVLGLGGYAAGPAVVAAYRCGVRSAILNPDLVPGLANRYLSNFANLIVLQWEASLRQFGDTARCRVLGCPIRREFAAADRAAGFAAFGLDPARPVLMVTGASLGARTINQAMQRVWPEFWRRHTEWQLLHLTGSADEADVRDAYAAAGSPAVVQAYTHEMPHALAMADVVVSRAGASTLAELTALGKPALLLPYPHHRDQHQRSNAEVLAHTGAAVVIEDRIDAESNARAIAPALEKLADADLRSRMARAGARIGRLDAADRVAEWMCRTLLPAPLPHAV